jgi:hypothetical protein
VLPGKSIAPIPEQLNHFGPHNPALLSAPMQREANLRLVRRHWLFGFGNYGEMPVTFSLSLAFFEIHHHCAHLDVRRILASQLPGVT